MLSTETRGGGQNTGCLSFTRANRSVHGLGKWFAKFRTGKFRPGIAFVEISSIYRKTAVKA